MALPKITKANSPPGPSSQGRFEGNGGSQPIGPSECEDDGAFEGDESRGGKQDLEGRLQEASDVKAHPDRHEKDPEQQAFEGVDGGLDGAPVLGLRQKQACDEGAQRHRETAHLRQQSRRDDDEEAGRHEKLGRAGCRDEVEKGPHQEAADRDDHHKRNGGLGKGPSREPACPRLVLAPSTAMANRIGATARSWNSSAREGGSPDRRIERF
jgi:hypothetical protein